MSLPIQLIVGLGNPGKDYAATRHNAGIWFIERLADAFSHGTFREEKKFQGIISNLRVSIDKITDASTGAALGRRDVEIPMLIPTTFMNLSGFSVAAFAKFYKIPAEAILVAHDELDLPAGVIRLKKGGGHAGHNGLQNIIAQLGTPEFVRLRIGITRPKDSSEVANYVLKPPSKSDRELIDLSIDKAIMTLPLVLNGDFSQAMNRLHGV